MFSFVSVWGEIPICVERNCEQSAQSFHLAIFNSTQWSWKCRHSEQEFARNWYIKLLMPLSFNEEQMTGTCWKCKMTRIPRAPHLFHLNGYNGFLITEFYRNSRSKHTCNAFGCAKKSLNDNEHRTCKRFFIVFLLRWPPHPEPNYMQGQVDSQPSSDNRRKYQRH